MYKEEESIRTTMRKWGFDAPAHGEEWASSFEKLNAFFMWADEQLMMSGVEPKGERRFFDREEKFIISFQRLVEICGGNNAMAKSYAIELPKAEDLPLLVDLGVSIETCTEDVAEETEEYVRYDISQKTVHCDLTDENLKKLSRGDKLALGLALLITHARPHNCFIFPVPLPDRIRVDQTPMKDGPVTAPPAATCRALERLGWEKIGAGESFQFFIWEG